MGMPTDIPIIDTMIGLPSHDRREIYKFLAPDLRDDESGTFKMPAQYMFKDIPEEIDEGVDPVAVTLYNMDRFGVERAMINVGNETRDDPSAPPRSIPTGSCPASRSTRAAAWTRCDAIKDFHQEFGLVAVTSFPAGCPTADQRCAVLPDLRHVRGAGPAHLHHRRRARPARAAGAAEGGVPGRGLLVLPRADHRHAPRRRAVGGSWPSS